MNKNKIIEAIYIDKNNDLHKALRKNIPKHYQDDMLHHLMVQILELKEATFINAFDNGKLMKLITTIMYWQWNSKSSLFWKEYRNRGSWKEIYVDGDSKHYLNNVQEEIYDIQEIINSDRLDKIDDILNRIDPINAYCFKKHFLEGLTYRQIGLETGVSKTFIQTRTNKAFDLIKSKLKE